MKVVPNTIIYLQKMFHIFLRSLSIFLENSIEFYVEWKFNSEQIKILIP
jgi:hypothetical protein